MTDIRDAKRDKTGTRTQNIDTKDDTSRRKHESLHGQNMVSHINPSCRIALFPPNPKSTCGQAITPLHKVAMVRLDAERRQDCSEASGPPNEPVRIPHHLFVGILWLKQRFHNFSWWKITSRFSK